MRAAMSLQTGMKSKFDIPKYLLAWVVSYFVFSGPKLKIGSVKLNLSDKIFTLKGCKEVAITVPPTYCQYWFWTENQYLQWVDWESDSYFFAAFQCELILSDKLSFTDPIFNLGPENTK